MCDNARNGHFRTKGGDRNDRFAGLLARDHDAQPNERMGQPKGERDEN